MLSWKQDLPPRNLRREADIPNDQAERQNFLTRFCLWHSDISSEKNSNIFRPRRFFPRPDGRQPRTGKKIYLYEKSEVSIIAVINRKKELVEFDFQKIERESSIKAVLCARSRSVISRSRWFPKRRWFGVEKMGFPKRSPILQAGQKWKKIAQRSKKVRQERTSDWISASGPTIPKLLEKVLSTGVNRTEKICWIFPQHFVRPRKPDFVILFSTAVESKGSFKLRGVFFRRLKA